MEKLGKLPLSKNENGPFRVNYWSSMQKWPNLKGKINWAILAFSSYPYASAISVTNILGHFCNPRVCTLAKMAISRLYCLIRFSWFILHLKAFIPYAISFFYFLFILAAIPGHFSLFFFGTHSNYF